MSKPETKSTRQTPVTLERHMERVQAMDQLFIRGITLVQGGNIAEGSNVLGQAIDMQVDVYTEPIIRERRSLQG